MADRPSRDAEVIRADKFTVSLEIRETDKIRSQHFYEPDWTAARMKYQSIGERARRRFFALSETISRTFEFQTWPES